LEVQGRTAHAPGRLSDALAWAWARRWAALAFATVLTVTVLVVEAQPVRSPWWTYADADASYTASSLNMMLGRKVAFVDHPGLPVTEAVAVAFGVEGLLQERSLSEHARLAFVDRTMLDLDRVRGTFRGFAIVFYLAGTLLSFLLAARLFRHWTYGFAAGLLWIAAPGLVAMSIQLRPDVLLAVLCIAFAFAVARALERRSVLAFAASAFLVGFTVMVKLHAFALLPALAVAALWRPARDEHVLALPRRLAAWARTRLGTAVLLVWLGVALLMNAARFPFSLTNGQIALGLLLAAVAAGGLALARFGPLRFYGLLVSCFVAGMYLPVTIDVPDGLRAFVYLTRNLTGNNVQEGVEPFSTPLSQLHAIVGTPVVIVFLLALVAAALGIVRRDPLPVVWAVGALAMGATAYARPPNVHYFAPSFVLASFALLWLLQREPRVTLPLLAWPVVLYVMWPAWRDREAPAEEQARFAALVEPAKQYVDAQLKPGEIALVPSYWPFADSRYFELVQIYVDHTPPYPYRYLPTTAAVRPYAKLRELRPRFFIGPQAASPGVQQLQLGDLGVYTVQKAGGGDIVAEITNGPGVTESW
jgi:dolichyl-phosphate-mannose-protein mannosyltransferase